jgi:small-conductance mechanosensitive channel
MQGTPLQAVFLRYLMHPESRMIVETMLAIIFALLTLSLRLLRSTATSGALMCAIGFALDVAASPTFAGETGWTRIGSGAAEVLVLWGLIRLMFDAAELVARRRRRVSSTIFKDILLFLLYGMVLLAILRVDFRVDPTPLFASTAVVAVVAGLALQENLGNIFSGLTLQLSKPFAPGDWVRSGNHVGRVQGIRWRSTWVITRANEKLEIPNSMLAKDVLVNYSNGVVADEISIGLSYSAPPNYVREVILETLRGAPTVLQNPPPQILTWEYGEHAIQYRVRYWWPPACGMPCAARISIFPIPSARSGWRRKSPATPGPTPLNARSWRNCARWTSCRTCATRSCGCSCRKSRYSSLGREK